jgi:hypothetical protein
LSPSFLPSPTPALLPPRGRRRSPAASKPEAGTLNGTNANGTAANVGGLFPPQSKSLGLEPTATLSPALEAKIVYAGVTNPSFTRAAEALDHLADVPLGVKRAERHTRHIGEERCAERDAAVAAYQALPLVERKGVPHGVVAPALAVVSVDGGRLQILDRTAACPTTPSADEDSATASDIALSPADDTDAADATSPDGQRRGTHWREDKIGLLMTMRSVVSALDPCPTVPSCFVDPTRIVKLTRELKTKRAAEGDDGLAEAADDSLPDPLGPVAADTASCVSVDNGVTLPEALLHSLEPTADSGDAATVLLRVYAATTEVGRNEGPPGAPAVPAACVPVNVAAVAVPTKYKPPEVQSRSAVATRQPWKPFGPMVAAAAWAAGFYGASQKAFVADGSANNWTLWRRHFSSFTPVLDFIHALSYVFASAMAGRKFAEGWPVYTRWIAWVWSGEVAQVIVELAQRQAELGVPEKEDGETSPRQVVATALGYLQENKDRMRYATFRQSGLPMTSSLVESLVKQFNYRVKGSEKLWSEEGAEGILQLRADVLSDGAVLDDFWQRREAGATGQTRHRRSA